MGIRTMFVGAELIKGLWASNLRRDLCEEGECNTSYSAGKFEVDGIKIPWVQASEEVSRHVVCRGCSSGRMAQTERVWWYSGV